MIYTVGHSTHTELEFVQLVSPYTNVLVDVRSHRSSRWPWWSESAIRSWSDLYGFRYEVIHDLGGWTAEDIDLADPMRHEGVDLHAYAHGAFPKQRIAKDRELAREQRNARDRELALLPTWTNQGLHDYSWYMSTRRFDNGLNDLLDLSIGTSCAIFCAEVLWWKCHRSMVADRLVWSGVEVEHIMPNRRPTRHTDALGNRLERYDPRIKAMWGPREPAADNHTVVGGL